MFKRLLFVLSSGALLAGGCLPGEPISVPDGPVPTTHPFFAPKTPVSAFPTSDSVPTSRPTQAATAIPTDEATLIPPPSRVITITWFDDTFPSDIRLETVGSLSVEEDRDISHAGTTSLAVTGEDGSSLRFQVRSSAPLRLLSDQVLGLSFWLYTGTNEVDVDQLLVEVHGSDNVHYWVEDDTSALTGLDTFSGRRLYGLGLNRAIDPDTWIRIEILLENLVYDPNFDEEPVEDFVYEYITGFSILLTQGFSGTIYLDELQVLMWESE